MNDRWEKLVSFIQRNKEDMLQAAGRLQTRVSSIKPEDRESTVKEFIESGTKLDKQNIELLGLLSEGRTELFDTLLDEYIETNQKRRVEEEKKNAPQHGHHAHAHAHAKGFSLIELLIVVAIILIIAAIAVPRLLSARTTAIEGKAASTTRTVANNVMAYNLKWNNMPAALTNLGGTACDTTAPTATAACLMDDAIASQLAAPGFGQYVFTYTTTGGAFTLNADPAASSSAKRHYYIDGGLTVHYSDTAAAAATDPSL